MRLSAADCDAVPVVVAVAAVDFPLLLLLLLLGLDLAGDREPFSFRGGFMPRRAAISGGGLDPDAAPRNSKIPLSPCDCLAIIVTVDIISTLFSWVNNGRVRQHRRYAHVCSRLNQHQSTIGAAARQNEAPIWMKKWEQMVGRSFAGGRSRELVGLGKKRSRNLQEIMSL